MKVHNGMRPQDIVILLKIVSLGKSTWMNKDLSKQLYISGSEVSQSLNRSEMAGLYNPNTKKVFRQSLMEFIQYGLRYVYPARPGSMTNGVLTAHSHPFMTQYFDAELKYVWPDPIGYDRGLSIEPLYNTVTKAVKEDPLLYKLLALIDVIRVGRVREMQVAIKELEKQIINEPSR